MWGICLDWSKDCANLFQRAIEYQLDADNHIANVLQPINNIRISSDSIKLLAKPPIFIYGALVSPVNHPDIIGEIREIIWNFKKNDYNYYITVNGRKKSKRYYTDDLIERKF